MTTTDPLVTFERSWQRAWASLGVGAPADLMHRLLAAYDEPQRRYHTRQHLHECLAHWESARALPAYPGEVELALWFHDAIYEVRGADNEQRSADWLADEAARAGLAPDAVQRLRALVLATKHDALPTTADEQVLVDVDLAILGAPRGRFDEHERQVREEYAWVPGWLFKRKRREALAHFLARPRLYATDHFHALLEPAARANLQHSLTQLGA